MKNFMKKALCLALVLSIVMMTMVIAPIGVSAAAFYAFDDFNNSDTLDTTKWAARYLGNKERIAIVENSTFDTGGTGKSVMLTGKTYN